MAPLVRAWPSKTKSTSLASSTKGRFILVATLLCGLCCFVHLPGDMLSLDKFVARHLRFKIPDSVTTYDQKNIMDTAKYFPHFVPRLLVFDGQGKFEVFGIEHKEGHYFESLRYSWRDYSTVPLLIRALKENFPGRFRPGQPVFQMLFSGADATSSACVNNRDDCPVDSFAPFALFGTTPKDHSIFPTLKSFPFAYFADCLYDFKIHGRDTCQWTQTVNKELEWDSLVNTVFWRGSDFPFMSHYKEFEFAGSWMLNNRVKQLQLRNATHDEILKDLTTAPYYNRFGPRWRAALQSVLADNETIDGTSPWIDSRFTGGRSEDARDKLATLDFNVNGESMSAYEMSKYKYQIDLGGGGGTTWGGTISKLMMPGVLFHHETVNMDWFYDIMVPWEHYVPVKWDLSDLREQYELAEKDPELMKKISSQATKFAEYLMSKEYMEKVYQELFVDYLGDLVSSYKPTGSWEDMQRTYQDKKYELFSVAVCSDDSKCILQLSKDHFINQQIINVGMVPSDEGIFESKPEQELGIPAEA
jgi:hypothetical protein